MNVRRFLLAGFVLLFVAAPGAALVCETGCGTSKRSLSTSTPEDCHQGLHEEPGTVSRLLGNHDCGQHAAVATVPLKTESNRAASSQPVAVLTLHLVDSDRTSSREAIWDHDLAPPGPSSRLIAPLRI